MASAGNEAAGSPRCELFSMAISPKRIRYSIQLSATIDVEEVVV